MQLASTFETCPLHGWARSHRTQWQRGNEGTNFSSRLFSPELCFLPRCLVCCLIWHNLLHSHSLCYGAAKRYPWPGFPSGFWGKEFTLRGSLYQLHANCVLSRSPQNFLHLSLLFLFVFQCCSYFFPNDEVLGQESILVTEYHRDFCQHLLSIEVTVLYG